MKQLVIGVGAFKTKRLTVKYNNEAPDKNTFEDDAIMLDINSDHKPDVVWDLNKLPLPFEDNQFGEIHAYDVLEHVGSLGDYKSFFAFYTEIWRILKPGGHLIALVPHWKSMWAFGDPSHVRIINYGTLEFLSQKSYEDQVGNTAMSDFRYLYKGDLRVAWSDEYKNDNDDYTYFAFVLKAFKRRK